MEQDGFEARLRLSKFLQGSASNEQNCRGAVSFCLKNMELAEELIECFMESLEEVPLVLPPSRPHCVGYEMPQSRVGHARYAS